MMGVGRIKQQLALLTRHRGSWSECFKLEALFDKNLRQQLNR